MSTPGFEDPRPGSEPVPGPEPFAPVGVPGAPVQVGPPGYLAAGTPYAAPPVAPAQGTDGLAITSLVFGIIGGSLLAIVFGFVGLSRVKKTGRKGRGLAIAGVVLGFVWLVVSIVGGVWFANRVSDNVDRLAAGPHTAGQCFDLADGATLDTADIKDCAQPHRWELYAVKDLPAGTYPGDDDLTAQANQFCGQAAGTYFAADVDPNATIISYSTPSEGAWSLGSRQILCLAGNADGTPLTGSLAR